MKRERERREAKGKTSNSASASVAAERREGKRGAKRTPLQQVGTQLGERERGDKVSSSGLDFPDLLFLLPFVLFSSGSHVSVFRKEWERGMDRRKEAQSAFSRVITFLIPPVSVKSTLLTDDYLRVRILWRNHLYSSLCKLALVTEVGYMIYIDVWW